MGQELDERIDVGKPGRDGEICQDIQKCLSTFCLRRNDEKLKSFLFAEIAAVTHEVFFFSLPNTHLERGLVTLWSLIVVHRAFPNICYFQESLTLNPRRNEKARAKGLKAHLCQSLREVTPMPQFYRFHFAVFHYSSRPYISSQTELRVSRPGWNVQRIWWTERVWLGRAGWAGRRRFVR